MSTAKAGWRVAKDQKLSNGSFPTEDSYGVISVLWLAMHEIETLYDMLVLVLQEGSYHGEGIYT